MKKSKLKRWVKVTLLIIGAIIFIQLLHLGINKAEKDIQKCVEDGYTRNYCIKKLS